MIKILLALSLFFSPATAYSATFETDTFVIEEEPERIEKTSVEGAEEAYILHYSDGFQMEIQLNIFPYQEGRAIYNTTFSKFSSLTEFLEEIQTYKGIEIVDYSGDEEYQYKILCRKENVEDKTFDYTTLIVDYPSSNLITCTTNKELELIRIFNSIEFKGEAKNIEQARSSIFSQNIIEDLGDFNIKFPRYTHYISQTNGASIYSFDYRDGSFDIAVQEFKNLSGLEKIKISCEYMLSPVKIFTKAGTIAQIQARYFCHKYILCDNDNRIVAIVYIGQNIESELSTIEEFNREFLNQLEEEGD